MSTYRWIETAARNLAAYEGWHWQALTAAHRCEFARRVVVAASNGVSAPVDDVARAVIAARRATRTEVNRRVAEVFELARDRRWELGQIQDRAVREALSLT